MRGALAASFLLHAALLAAWLAPPRGGPEEVPPIEVELVQQPAERQGGAPAARDERRPEAEAAAAPAPRPAPPPVPAPAVNLGDAASDLDPLSVTGENVVPPAPDALFRNRPPSYPAAAARAGAEGTVQLLIRVSASGVPEQVAVAASSGHASLDRAASEAVRLWRFRPARSGGKPVPFDYVMNIRFTLGGR